LTTPAPLSCRNTKRRASVTSRSPPFCVSTRWWAFRPLPIPSKPTPRTRPCGRVFGVGLLFTSRKPKARPWGRVSGFRRLPSPSPPSQHQKRVHMDAFLVSACSPPLEDQKHAHGGVFLVFGGFLPHPLQADTSRKPKARPWGRVSGFQHPHLPPLPSPTCQTRKTHRMGCVFRVWHAQNTKTANTFAFFVFCG